MMRKPYTVDPIELAWEIVRSVNAAMPIGAGNIREGPNRLSSEERTAGWASTLVDASREGSLRWIKKEGTWQAIDSAVQQYELVPASEDRYGEDVLYCVNTALYAAMLKAGNCEEMSSLGLVQLCQRIAAIADDIPIPDFSFRMFISPGDLIDHVVLKISIGDKHILCDPWLKRVAEINDHNLEAWREEFEKTEVPSDDHETVSLSEKDRIWDIFKRGIKTNRGIECVEVSSRQMAKEIADLYERSYQEAVLSLYNKKFFDVKNMSSALQWHDEPVHIHFQKYVQKTSLDYYDKKNLEMMRLFIEHYEFPKRVAEDDLLDHINLYIYLFANDNFSPKPSVVHIIRTLNTLSFEALCISCGVPMQSMSALQLYGAQVLAGLSHAKPDKKAMALIKALLSDELSSVAALCDALKMTSSTPSTLWSKEDSWEAMPKELKNFVEKRLLKRPHD